MNITKTSLILTITLNSIVSFAFVDGDVAVSDVFSQKDQEQTATWNNQTSEIKNLKEVFIAELTKENGILTQALNTTFEKNTPEKNNNRPIASIQGNASTPNIKVTTQVNKSNKTLFTNTVVDLIQKFLNTKNKEVNINIATIQKFVNKLLVNVKDIVNSEEVQKLIKNLPEFLQKSKELLKLLDSIFL